MKNNLLKFLVALCLFAACDSSILDDAIDDNMENPIDNNEGAVELACKIDEETVLKDISNGIDYIADCNIVVSAALTIEPGVTIAFKSDTYFWVDESATIIAKGTETEPIIFRGENAIKGYWKGIAIESSDVRNEFSYVQVSDAGSTPVTNWFNHKAALILLERVGKGKLTVLNTTITNCDGYGFATDNNTEVTGFANNTFEKNTFAAVSVTTNNVSKLGEASIYLNNGFNGVEIRASKLNTQLANGHIWKKNNYNVAGDLEVEEKLNIEPGAFFTFEPGTYLWIDENATIIAKGSNTEPIVFTGTVTSVPSWKGIVLESGSVENIFSYCKISYGGSDPATSWAGSNTKANLFVIKRVGTGKLKLENCTIENSGGCGIFADDDASFTESDNTFSNIPLNNICN